MPKKRTKLNYKKIIKENKVLVIMTILVLAGFLYITYFEQPQTLKEQCEVKGGVWVEKQIGGFLDLNVNTPTDCGSWSGWCVEDGMPRPVSSFTIGKCSKLEDCILLDIWEPTCLIPK